jgi:hypothetical protein
MSANDWNTAPEELMCLVAGVAWLLRHRQR